MMLAVFENPTSGAIWAGGKRIDSLPPHKRNMGVVFQNYALFPHMTVSENVAFPLKMRDLPRALVKERVDKALDMVQLGSLAERRPSQLSGGQQQRVASGACPDLRARSGLDGRTARRAGQAAARTNAIGHQRSASPAGADDRLCHARPIEALTMSDRIAIFNRGKIQQIANPPTSTTIQDAIRRGVHR